MDGNTPRTGTYRGPGRAQVTAILALVSLLTALILVAVGAGSLRAYAAVQATVGLGTAESFSVLAGQAVTNTGPTVLSDDLGVSPGDAITGFPPGQVLGARYEGNAVAGQAQSDLTIAYDDAAGRASDGANPADLGGSTLIAGVYTSDSSAQLTGTLTLDGQDDPNSVFIFQIASALTTATNSRINLINGAQSCNVFFQVGSSATVGVDTEFVGTILALTSISVLTGATVDGRALARNGSVTLDNNVFTSSACDVATPTPTPTPTANPTATDNPTATESPTATENPTATGNPTVPESPSPVPTETQTDSETEGPSPSATATKTQRETERAPSDTGSATGGGGSGSGGGGGGGSLADTGSSGLTTLFGLGGIVLVLAAGGTLVGRRLRARPAQRH